MIADGRICIKGSKSTGIERITKSDLVTLDTTILQSPEASEYYIFYKPKGIECTLNPSIPENLQTILTISQRVFPVGRLDKESEGLLLLTNDGSLYNFITSSKYKQEKEYLVEVDKAITSAFIDKMALGVEIMGRKTLPAKLEILSETTFKIILIQGLNRQIRRMCYQLEYEVLSLKRIRIAHLTLGDLAPGEWRLLQDNEIEVLKSLRH